MSECQSGRSWFGLFMGDRGWIAMLLTLAMLGCTWFSIDVYAQARDLETSGVSVWATSEGRRTEDTDTGTRYFLTYGVILRGEQLLREVEVTKSEYDQPREIIFKVNLVTDDAALIASHRARLEESGEALQKWALLAGLAALGMGWWSGRDATRAVLARRWGVEEEAYVTDRKTSYSGKGPPQTHIRFRSHSGVEGRSFSRYEFNFPSVYPGWTIRVFVHNGRAWWAGDVGSRLDKPRTLPRVLRTHLPRALQPRNRHES